MFSFLYENNQKVVCYKDNKYKFCGPYRNNGSLYTCVFNQCEATVKLNKEETKIIGGFSIHKNHNIVKHPTPNVTSTPPSNKTNNTTPVYNNKKKMVKKRIPTNDTLVLQSDQTKITTSAAPQQVSQIIGRTLINTSDISTQTDMWTTSSSTETQTDLDSAGFLNMRDGFINKIRDQVLDIVILRKQVANLEKKMNSYNSPSKNNHHQHITRIQPSSYLFIGDSHVRGLSGIMSEIMTKKCNIEAVFHPGAGYKTVADIHHKSPKLVNPVTNNPVIIMCGTNDVCSTPWDTMKQGIDSLITKFRLNELYILGVPFRFNNNRRLNSHISRLNTKIKNYVMSTSSNIVFIDPNKLLKPQDYAKDKLHLNRNGKIKLCKRIKTIIFQNPVSPPHASPIVPLDISDPAPHMSSVPSIDNLIDLSSDTVLAESTFDRPVLHHADQTIDYDTTVLTPSPTIDTPIFPDRVQQILSNERQDNTTDYTYYRLTNISHSFNNVMHSSPFPDTAIIQNEQTQIEMPIPVITPRYNKTNTRNFIEQGQVKKT
uniref:Uncharacterized protein n=1 Tax=Cacopsylla melanoneura TaxID=428564 RepID=A0A8D8RDE8_9HEMI